MRRLAICALGVLFTCPYSSADDLQDAYTRGYSQGYKDGQASAPGTSDWLGRAEPAGTLFIPGSRFDTSIGTTERKAGDVQVSPDSTIAIIPNDALPAVSEKLGQDFMKDYKIQLNN